MSDSQHYPWQEGMPTKPDVDLLLGAFPSLNEGDQFRYDDIAELLGLSLPDDHRRFRTITDAWRARLSEQGVIVECIRGEAFYVADARAVTALTHGVIKRTGRLCRRQRQKLNAVRPRDDQERNTILHHGRLLHEIERHSKSARATLLPSTAVPPAVAAPKPDDEAS